MRWVIKKFMQTKPIQIAIDGPVAAGKGTVARLVAERLGITYIDTGAMYRVAALLAMRAGIPWVEEEKIADLVDEAKIELRPPMGEEKDGRLITVLLNREDVSWKIRTEAISQAVPLAARIALVRQVLVKKQQTIASKQSVIMEGRDITFRVLPKADLKIYLTASPEERAKRRQNELLMRGEAVTYEKVLEDLKKRDAQDMERAADPLQIAQDAWVLDTTGMTIEGVVEKIVRRVRTL
jgi:CMP/dCMP kinase